MKKKLNWPLQGVAHIKSTFNNTVLPSLTEKERPYYHFYRTTWVQRCKKRYRCRTTSWSLPITLLWIEDLNPSMQLKGTGAGKFSATKGLHPGLQVLTISTIPGIAHNGCRLERSVVVKRIYFPSPFSSFTRPFHHQVRKKVPPSQYCILVRHYAI